MFKNSPKANRVVGVRFMKFEKFEDGQNIGNCIDHYVAHGGKPPVTDKIYYYGLHLDIGLPEIGSLFVVPVLGTYTLGILAEYPGYIGGTGPEKAVVAIMRPTDLFRQKVDSKAYTLITDYAQEMVTWAKREGMVITTGGNIMRCLNLNQMPVGKGCFLRSHVMATEAEQKVFWNSRLYTTLGTKDLNKLCDVQRNILCDALRLCE